MGLVRFGVSLEDVLLVNFDDYIKKKSYQRRRLIRWDWFALVCRWKMCF